MARARWIVAMGLGGACGAGGEEGPVDPGVDTSASSFDTEVGAESDTTPPDTEGVQALPCERPRPPAPMPPATVGADAYARTAVGPGGEHICLFVEDLDLDGHLDLGWINDRAYLSLRWGRADGGFDAQEVEFPRNRPENYGACTPVPGPGGGRWDVLVGGRDAVYRLEQTAPRTFTDVGSAAPLPEVTIADGLRTGLLAPFDLDGQPPLDLIVGIYGRLSDECVADDPGDTDQAVQLGEFREGPAHCFLADGAGRYTLDTGTWCPSPVLTTPGYVAYGVAFDDLDGDGATDAAIGVDFGRNTLLKGQPGGGLRPWPAGHGFDVYNHGMGIAVADFDHNGRPDLFLTDIGTNDVYQGVGCETWFHANDAFGTPEATRNVISWGASTLDVDRNGASDVFVSMSAELPMGFEQPLCGIDEWGLPTASPMLLLHDGQTPNPRFTRVDIPHLDGRGSPAYFEAVHLATGDLDHDGRPDAVVATRDGVVAMHNRVPAQGHWLRVQVLGSDGLPVYGARVQVLNEAGRGWTSAQWPGNGMSGHSELIVDLGLGAQAEPVRVEVTWPDGHRKTLDAVEVDTILRVRPD